MALRLTFGQIEKLMKICKQGAGYYVELNGGQGFAGNNLLYISRQIKDRFSLEVSALQLKKLFDKNQ